MAKIRDLARYFTHAVLGSQRRRQCACSPRPPSAPLLPTQPQSPKSSMPTCNRGPAPGECVSILAVAGVPLARRGSNRHPVWAAARLFRYILAVSRNNFIKVRWNCHEISNKLLRGRKNLLGPFQRRPHLDRCAHAESNWVSGQIESIQA